MSERSIFLAALDIADSAKRAEFLDAACGNDENLQQHIEGLIAAEGNLGSFLGKPHVDLEATAEHRPVTERPGSQIGPYKLLQKLGEGGMGEVWVAKQSEPVKRNVAIKLIKTGMDSRAVLTRFEAERQALALMDHPHIARVFDGGIAASGQPFFVMELVNGLPLNKFCDECKLTRSRPSTWPRRRRRKTSCYPIAGKRPASRRRASCLRL